MGSRQITWVARWLHVARFLRLGYNVFNLDAGARFPPLQRVLNPVGHLLCDHKLQCKTLHGWHGILGLC